MGIGTGGVGRWTRYFAAVSTSSLVAVEALFALGVARRTVAVVAVFGFVLPMVFGVGYVLLPSYVGRTLAHQRAPGVHLAAVAASAALAAAWTVFDPGDAALVAAAVAWSAGVAVFAGSLAWTAIPALRERPEIVLRTAELPQRSTRLATAAIPVAVTYLLVGTLAFLALVGRLPSPFPVTLPRVLHLHAAGFAALLVFALGARLSTGFFHVAPPKRATGAVLVAGAVGPALLAAHLWTGPWFRVGAAVEALAFLGYAGLVGYVALESDWQRVGLHGVLLGALAGLAAVAVALHVAFGGASAAALDAHATLVLAGFFPLTIAGYAFQFFPVTTGRFAGATRRGALLVLALLAAGAFGRAGGLLVDSGVVRVLGGALGVLGALGYAYLLGRRVLGRYE